LLVGGLVFGGLLRWVASDQAVGARAFWEDDWDYYTLGVEQARSGVYRSFPEWDATAYRMPLYPTLLTAARWAHPGPKTARRVQAALDTAAIYGVYLLGGALAGPLTGGLASAMYALGPIPIDQVPVLMLEGFLGFLVVAFALAAVYWVERPGSLARGALAGACMGMSLMCRSTLFAFPLLLGAYVPARFGLRKTWKAVAVFLVCSYVALGPWALRNAGRFGGFIPFENGAGVPGLLEASVGLLKVSALPEFIELGSNGELVAKFQALNETSRKRELMSLALKRILLRPYSNAVSSLKRVPILWEEQLPWIVAAAGLLLLPALDEKCTVVVLLAAYFNIHLIMSVLPRFARPAFGLWCALGAAGLVTALRTMAGLKLPKEKALADTRVSLFPKSALVMALGLYVVWLSFLPAERKGLSGWTSRAREECWGSQAGHQELVYVNGEGIDLAAKGRYAYAEQRFSDVLEKAPCYEESLISRAVARSRQGKTYLATLDYLSATILVESGQPRCGSDIKCSSLVREF
jgi:4-amino-4-deoxy-L-arabinose transferase-like glycosyltransferase